MILEAYFEVRAFGDQHVVNVARAERAVHAAVALGARVLRARRGRIARRDRLGVPAEADDDVWRGWGILGTFGIDCRQRQGARKRTVARAHEDGPIGNPLLQRAHQRRNGRRRVIEHVEVLGATVGRDHDRVARSVLGYAKGGGRVLLRGRLFLARGRNGWRGRANPGAVDARRINERVVFADAGQDRVEQAATAVVNVLEARARKHIRTANFTGDDVTLRVDSAHFTVAVGLALQGAQRKNCRIARDRAVTVIGNYDQIGRVT